MSLIQPCPEVQLPYSKPCELIKTVVYVAHPIGGDVEYNLRDLYRILNRIFTQSDLYTPIAPYVSSVMSLNDFNTGHRWLGIEANKVFFERKAFDEMWLTGQFISEGMQKEIDWCNEFNIPVLNKINML